MPPRRHRQVLLCVLAVAAIIAAPCVDASVGPRRTLQQAPGATGAVPSLLQGIGGLVNNALKSVKQVVTPPLSVPLQTSGTIVRLAGTTAAPTSAVTTTLSAAGQVLMPTSSPSAGGSKYAYAATLHNVEREKHQNTSDVTYDAGLETTAQNYANKCMFQHSGTAGLGENLYMVSGPAGSLPPQSQVVADAVAAWYAEISAYNYANPGFSEATGHFTQVVWANTAKIGCGVAFCAQQVAGITIGNESYLVVCEYSPAGNVNSSQEFTNNVRPLKAAPPPPLKAARPPPPHAAG